VTRAGANIPLRPKEFDLLLALVRRNGQVVARSELLKEVWGYDDSVMSRTVDTHISELRRKLEADPSEPRHILTVLKTGYRLKLDP
jgi:two-component system alkaline phosphatase synthesis response regulator PhoP